MELKTGDLILCDDLEYKNWGLFSWFIKFMSRSDFSHIAMIVKDPEFTDPPLKGTYVWMSGTSKRQVIHPETTLLEIRGTLHYQEIEENT